MEELTVALSPCPNDTFTFGPLVLGWVKIPVRLRWVFEDIETLNRLALRGEIPLIKISYALFPEVWERYQALPVGAALGRGCGPLLVASEPLSPEDLSRVEVWLPGEHTTAHLLFRLAFPEARHRRFVLYHEILPALISGKARAGVLIHEERFVYEKRGLYLVRDLGAWWEEETGLPLPLGGPVVRRDLPEGLKSALTRAVRESLRLARERFPELLPFIRSYAQDLSREVISTHISTYVNEYTEDLGEEGQRALQELVHRAGAKGARDLVWGER
ncbi:1,4-dihydroxy-6-naphthoate synthase [Thermosulfurimonas marina]|uniref:1,4-dihydroxy-6-naphtoate synthase n=1 Tax=Thermosulfurimonas marina TaxID=2047767 RepID=A0A6H1WUW3_9BACT|nr:1,4-dihydroxy-6-naphthoate synthase [Thermosulfurimonas marina]